MVARTMTRARFSSVRLSRTGTSLEPPCEEHGTLQQVAWRITGAHIPHTGAHMPAQAAGVLRIDDVDSGLHAPGQ